MFLFQYWYNLARLVRMGIDSIIIDEGAEVHLVHGAGEELDRWRRMAKLNWFTLATKVDLDVQYNYRGYPFIMEGTIVEQERDVAAWMEAYTGGDPEVYVDLYDMMDDNIIEHVSLDFSKFWEAEQKRINPALVQADLQPEDTWHTGDGDSFGPLTRWTRVQMMPDGPTYRVIYG